MKRTCLNNNNNANIEVSKIRNIIMGMVSSEALAGKLGITHKQVKKHILDYDVRAIPSGSSFMDAGRPQRKVLVDEEAFNQGLFQKASVLRRASTKDDKKKIK